jgi:hypothetical protein
MIEHEDNLMFDLLSQLPALALHDDIFAPDIRGVEDIYTKKNPTSSKGHAVENQEAVVGRSYLS